MMNVLTTTVNSASRPPDCVVSISGGIASGKSTLARSLADALGWPVASFGAYVRSVAIGRGLDDTRANLQAVGADLVRGGTDSFAREVLTAAGWHPSKPAILEGVRHLDVLDSIQRVVSPLDVVHVHVSTPDEDRKARALARGETDPRFETDEAHSTERDVRNILPALASIHVDGTIAVDVGAQRVLSLLVERGGR